MSRMPNQLRGTEYYNDYWSSVVRIHFMRDGGQDPAVPELAKKYPYTESNRVVRQGWSGFGFTVGSSESETQHSEAVCWVSLFGYIQALIISHPPRNPVYIY